MIKLTKKDFKDAVIYALITTAATAIARLVFMPNAKDGSENRFYIGKKGVLGNKRDYDELESFNLFVHILYTITNIMLLVRVLKNSKAEKLLAS